MVSWRSRFSSSMMKPVVIKKEEKIKHKNEIETTINNENKKTRETSNN